MSNRHIRRVSLSLHLSPEHSRADLRAMLQLKKWHQELNQTGTNPGDANMEMRRFHRNVYLAGLQLQLLNPQLCSHVAESMGRDKLTLDELCGELVSAQLLPIPPGEAPAPTPASEPAVSSDDFSKQQLRQMRALMSEALSRQPAPVAAAPDDASREELALLRGEVAQLKTLLNQQHLLLQQIRMSGRAAAPAAENAKSGQAEELDLSTLGAPAQKMKQIRQKGIF
ncbi:hypothetical protein [Kluyvera genomosp. 1]|uniref:hypothetical protein n=1 Tax=Kluyvera genomosp. 1 TaxID=2774053 RepID=UPI00069127EB|nr:hypothetical protein [Kluyvera genomosp. 1]